MSGNDFLDRWSQRKRAVEDEARLSAPVSPAATQNPEDVADGTDNTLSEPELLEKLGLPDPDSLQKGDDFTAFMADHIPSALRKRALRKLWLSDPNLANLDGLIDHGEDYTDAATVPQVFKTAYRVGKGFLREVLESEPEATPEAPESEEIVTTDPIDTPEPQQTVDPVSETQENQPEDPSPPEPRPRRMAFRSD